MDIVPFSKNKQDGFSLIGKMCTLNDYQQLQSYCNNVKISSKCLIIDMDRLTFCTSQGIGLFVAISNMLKKSNRSLILFKPRKEIKDVLIITAINSVIPIIEDDDELGKIV